MIMSKVDTKITFILNNIFFTIGVIGYTWYYWDQIKTDIKTISIRDTLAIGTIAILFSFIPNVIYYNLIKYKCCFLIFLFIH